MIAVTSGVDRAHVTLELVDAGRAAQLKVQEFRWTGPGVMEASFSASTALTLGNLEELKLAVEATIDAIRFPRGGTDAQGS